VLLASQSFAEKTDRLDRLDFRLAMHLKRRGIEVVILVPSSASTSKTAGGLKIYLFKPTPIVRSISRRVLKGSYIIDMFIRSLPLIKKENIDLLYAFFAIPPGVAMAICKKVTGRPLVLNVTGADIGIAKEIKYGFRLDPVANRLVNLVLKNTDQIIVPSHRFKELAIIAGADRKRITVIPWGVSLEKFPFVEKELREPLMIKKFNLKPKDRVILSLCRHARVKGLDYLLYAMPRILHEYPNVKLVLAGLGKETERLKDLAKNLKIEHNVIFPGYVRGEEKLKLLAAADIFVQPSLSDAFPVSALEAMASGKPFVITDKVGLADFLKNEECGLIVKSGNAKTLADAILKLLSDDNLRFRLGEKARRKAEEFAWDKIIRRVISVYHKAIL
jgi:glycosyltransferase involved in cell wall biosynthesis